MKNTTLLIAMLLALLTTHAQTSNMVVWSFEANGKILSHPVIDEDIIYFGSNDSYFYAVDIPTGEQVWSYKTKSAIHSKALIDNNIVYFKSGNDVFALNKYTGSEIWAFTSKGTQESEQLDLWDYHSGAAAVFESVIFFGLGNGKLQGFDLKTGQMKHELVLTGGTPIKCGLVIENSILYFGDWAGKIYAYNLETDKKVWEYETYEKQLYDTFGQINTQLSIYKDLLFFGGRNPELQVLDKNTGKLKWNYLEKDGGWISGDPLVLHDTLFIGGSDNHEMLAFNAITGEKYWKYIFLNNNFSKPLAYKNHLLFTTGDAYNVYGTSPGRGYLYAIDRSDGSLKNIANIGGNIYTTLVVEDDILFMGNADKHMYAVDLHAFLNDEPNLKAKGYNALDILGALPFPFSDSVKITYSVNYHTNLTIKINDLNENTIRDLFSGQIKQGEHFIMWDGKDNLGNVVQAGHYFCEISSGEYFKKVIIQKQ